MLKILKFFENFENYDTRHFLWELQMRRARHFPQKIQRIAMKSSGSGSFTERGQSINDKKYCGPVQFFSLDVDVVTNQRG